MVFHVLNRHKHVNMEIGHAHKLATAMFTREIKNLKKLNNSLFMGCKCALNPYNSNMVKGLTEKNLLSKEKSQI